jgi:hypothetical protein
MPRKNWTPVVTDLLVLLTQKGRSALIDLSEIANQITCLGETVSKVAARTAEVGAVNGCRHGS